MKHLTIILFLLILLGSCGKKGDPVYKESKIYINFSKII
tara:strand:+ start:657 stop:773 length:117 start_codon:yes stop_codon:yes gene_type:complete